LNFSERYSRQILFAPMGKDGQDKILSSHVVLIGCGALGSTMANTIVRAGAGHLTIVDPDNVELSNLQRQTLFDEEHARTCAKKAVAASHRLEQINSNVRIRPLTERLTPSNIERIIGRPDVVLDGTDNFPTRYLINDYCVRENIPWVYGGVAASYGVSMSILPHKTPCLRCIFPSPPPPEHSPTADTVGIIAPIAHIIASVQAAQALKIISGNAETIKPTLYTVDLWEDTFNAVKLLAPEPSCPCCGNKNFEFLEERS